jgi:hypothetical protein
LASFCCHPHTASSLLPQPFSLTGSIIDKFDIAARSILLFIPSCLDLVVRLSLSYRHRQSRHSLRDIQKQQSTHRFLIPLSDRAFHIHTDFPRDVADFFFYPHFYFRSPRDEVIAVNHSATTSTQPSTFPFCTTNTRSHLDATLVDRTTYPTFQSTTTQRTSTIYAQSSRPANPASERSATGPTYLH